MESIKRYLFFLLSFIVGFWTATQVYGKNVGAEGIIPNTRLHIGGHLFSPHHWMVDPIYAVLAWVIYKKQKKIPGWVAYFIIFFLLGMGSQGFTYSDWYIIYDQPYISSFLLILTFLIFGVSLFLVIRSFHSHDS